ncbi:MAG: hypothetical protein EPN62_14300 [Candidimonas sp.]|nr:MAG: hypothetical protein EPN77_12635 [Candidimonas sp.]TAM21368.1 MAG: hypothetical protein EPN62_14300 [Candidimonas sp.]
MAMARIGIAGFLHETNTFAQGLTPLARFIEADAWPGLIENSEILTATSGMNLAISGFIHAIQQTRHTLVPLLWSRKTWKMAKASYCVVCAPAWARISPLWPRWISTPISRMPCWKMPMRWSPTAAIRMWIWPIPGNAPARCCCADWLANHCLPPCAAPPF